MCLCLCGVEGGGEPRRLEPVGHLSEHDADSIVGRLPAGPCAGLERALGFLSLGLPAPSMAPWVQDAADDRHKKGCRRERDRCGRCNIGDELLAVLLVRVLVAVT